MTRSWSMRAGLGASAAALVAAGISAAPAGAAPTLPGLGAPHPVAALQLADWYGTAWTSSVLSPDNGPYALQHNQGRSNVALEQRSVRFPQKVGTPWKQVAVVAPGSAPAVGQWIREPGYNGIQFRLCRLAPDGKQCTAYSNIIVG